MVPIINKGVKFVFTNILPDNEKSEFKFDIINLKCNQRLICS